MKRFTKTGFALLAAGGVVALAACASGARAGSSAHTPRRQVLGCGVAVYGPESHLGKGHGTVVAGPVVWPEAETTRNQSSYRPRQGLAPFVKLLIFVKDGAPTTLSVPPAERSRLAFNYGAFSPRLTWRGIAFFKIADAPQILTFKPCSRAKTPSGWTSFAGGFLVKGGQCAKVNISRKLTHLARRSRWGRAAGSRPSGVIQEHWPRRRPSAPTVDRKRKNKNGRACRNRQDGGNKHSAFHADFRTPRADDGRHRPER